MNSRPLLGALILFILGWAQPVLAATEVLGEIEGDTVWTAAESPFLITEDVYFSPVDPGATLTIEPGVVVEFQEGTSLNVFGNLIVTGTPENNVQFTSAEASNWQVNIFDSTDTQLNNLKIAKSDQGLFNFNSKVTVNNLTIEEGAGSFYADDNEAVINGLKIESGDIMFYDNQTSLSNAIMNGGELMVYQGHFSLEGLTSNGSSLGIFNASASINNADMQNAASGAAMLVSNSTVSVNDSVLNNGANLGADISNNATVNMDDVSITNFAAPGIQVSGSSFTGGNLELSNNLIGFINNGSAAIHDSKIENNAVIGIVHAGDGTFTISNSLIAGNGVAGAQSSSLNPLDARGNYWGDPTGPFHETLNPEGVGDVVYGDALIDPWLSSYCEANCYSNIMFLPGIMSSRLYEDGEQLWEPGLLTQDAEFEALYLDESGKSINPDIYTKDVLDNGYAYGKFVDDLADLKLAGTINDFEAVPYDWRLSMEDVLNTGVKREDDTILYGTDTDEPYIKGALRRLATNSKSGKVTIVAHSNGGLVTKALINKLEDEASDLIDQIIFVGVPQLGTPQAIGSLLHGYDAGLPSIYPFILSPERSRDLAKDMPMIYQLMPFADYYDGEGADVYTPYVTFEDGVATKALIERYGYAVTPDELEDFLNGSEGRASATYDDLANPINANAGQLANALAMQSEIDSTWQAPNGIKVHQIAGIGEDTLAGINYKTIQKCVLSTLGVCHERAPALSYEPITMIDGDGTVVVPSALAMSDSDSDVERWWIDLDEYNGITLGPFRTKHASILEVDELRDLIFDYLILKVSTEAPSYLHKEQPVINSNDHLKFTLHSPLKLSAIASDGSVANEKETTIPGATYVRYGEVQVLTLPVDTEFTIVLDGESYGSFTLEMEEIIDNETFATSTLAAIPSSTTTKATISFESGSLEDAGVLQIDYDGDSTIDYSYSPVINETVYEPDPQIVIEKSSSGGNSRVKPKGQVLGTSTSATDLSNDLRRIQNLIILLTSLKGKISDQKYLEIENRVRSLLVTLILHIQQDSGL